MSEKNTENTTLKKGPNRQESNKGGIKQSLWEFIKFSFIAAAIVIPIRLWVAQPFIVSGASMAPTFENGEYLIVDEFSYHFRKPERGEVVVFRYPNNPSKFFIKRIIGLPGEKLVINNGKIRVYNKEFPEGVDIQENYLKTKFKDTLNITLNNHEYFVMGDNRPQSSDSRIWGPLPANLIVGRAWICLWPFNKATIYF